MADWYCVSGVSGGSGTLLDPWGTLANITQASLDGTSDTLWLSGTFQDQSLTWDSAGGVDADNPILIRGDLSGIQAIIDANNNVAFNHCLLVEEQDYVSIKNLTVKNANDGGNNGQGIHYINSTGNEIRNVLATGNKWNGFNLTCVANMLIADCEGSDNLIKGIAISGSYVTCQENVSNVTIQDCVANRNGRRGITISGANAAQNLNNVYINRCLSNGNGEGVQIDMCINVELTNSTISNNNLTGVDPFAAENGYGIWIQDCEGAVVTNNTISGHSTAEEIFVSGVAAFPVVGTGIYGNRIIHPSNSTDYAVSIFDDDIADIIVSGNYFEHESVAEEDANSTILCRAAVTNVYIYNNTFVGGYRAVRNAGQPAATFEIKNNIFLNQIDYGIWQNTAAGTINIDSNCYWVDVGTPQIFVGNLAKAGETAILTVDSNAIVEDPQLDSNYKPGNANLIGAGVKLSDYGSVDINGEPFPAVGRDFGCVQGTDATNHPFHPLNL